MQTPMYRKYHSTQTGRGTDGVSLAGPQSTFPPPWEREQALLFSMFPSSGGHMQAAAMPGPEEESAGW